MRLPFPRALAFLCAGLLALGSADAAPPANDNFAERIALPATVPIAVTAEDSGATLESGEIAVPNYPRSLWWSWTPAVSGTYVIDTAGSDCDNQLVVYRGNALTALERIGDGYNYDEGASLGRAHVNVTAGEEYQITVQGEWSDLHSIVLNVKAGVAITSPLKAFAVIGVPFSYQISASNSPYNFSATNLPSGLTYDHSTGVISGTPYRAPGNYGVVLSASSFSFEEVTARLQLTLSDTRPTITGADDWYIHAIQAHPLSYPISATQNPTGFSATGLPDGLTIDPQTGLISGTPTTGFGYFNATVSASNGAGTGPTKTIRFYVESAAPRFGDTTIVELYLGGTVKTQLTATNQPTGFTATKLPKWLKLDPLTGLLTGRPPVSGYFPIEVTASNAYGSGLGSVALFVFDRIANDFADRTVVSGNTVRRSVTTEGATEEPGEPRHAGVRGHGSIWMTWTAPETAPYRVGTDSWLPFAVYTGDSLETLVEVASNRDPGMGRPPTLVFLAKAGTVYQIAIDSPFGYSGNGIFILRKVADPSRVLLISADQGGTVTAGFLGKSYRQLGVQYTVQAIPAPGWLFDGWTGSFESSRATITFTMQEGLELAAHFIPSPFLDYRGRYVGVIGVPFESDEIPTSSGSGAIDLRLNANGSFTGSVTLSNGTFPFHGAFNRDGQFRGTITRPGQWPLTINLNVDWYADSKSLTGGVGDDLFQSHLSAERSSLDALRNPASVAGAYTFEMGAYANRIGTGHGTANISLGGAVRFAGVLPDGAPFSRGSAVNDSGAFALYATAYQGQGCLSGIIQLGDDGTSDFSGAVTWIRPPRGPEAKAVISSGGIGGQRYAAPPAGSRPLTLDRTQNNIAFQAVLEAGAQTGGWTVDRKLTLTLDNLVSASGRKPVSMSLDLKTGLYRGAFVDDRGGAHAFRGAILQRSNMGYGLFFARDEQGTITLTPIP